VWFSQVYNNENALEQFLSGGVIVARVHIICGMICSGKTFFSRGLREKYNGVILSTDEITLALPQDAIRDCFDEVSRGVNAYLLEKSVQIINAGVDVILDWGFWKMSDRKQARTFFAQHNVETVMYYLDTDEQTLAENTAQRNESVKKGETSAFYVDERLAEKCRALFEIPAESEIDVRIVNNRY